LSLALGALISKNLIGMANSIFTNTINAFSNADLGCVREQEILPL
jgi:hypothetical protein